jgi:hypothetical protein
MSVEERDLWLTWDAFQAWLTWSNRLRSADNKQAEQQALAVLAQLPQTTSYAALVAGTALAADLGTSAVSITEIP